MSWYKLAQVKEQTFPFYKDIVPQEPPVEEQYKQMIKDINLLKELTEYEMNTYQEAIKTLIKYDFDWKQTKFENDLIISVFLDKTYIIDSFPYPEPTEGNEWIYNLNDSGLYTYMPPQEFETTFWEDIPPDYTLYHGTYEDRISDILENGIETRNETRGISNRSTGSGVFTSDNPHEPEYSYEAVIQINVGQMKQEGYTPRVSKEEPLEEEQTRYQLAQKLGIEYIQEEYSSDGLSDSTIIFYDDIPSKYLSLYGDEI